MKIRDKIIVSFFVIVFLLLVSIIVKFFYIRQTYKKLTALTNGSATVDEDKEQSLRAEAIKKHLLSRFADLKSLRHDSSPLLVLETCLDVRLSLEAARSSLASLRKAQTKKDIAKYETNIEVALQRLMAKVDIFAARSPAEITAAEAFTTYSGEKPALPTLKSLLDRQRSICNELANMLPVKEQADKVVQLFGTARLEKEAAVAESSKVALAAFKTFARLATSSGVPGVGDIPAQLQQECFGVLEAETMDELRTAWGHLSTAFGQVSSQIPPPNAHPLVGRLSASLDELQKSWSNFVRTRVAQRKHGRAAQWALDNFEKEVTNAFLQAGKLERAIYRILARHRAGASGAAEEFTEELLAALQTIPVDSMTSSEAGLALTVHYEQRQWANIYDQQLNDLTFMIVFFALGVVLALGLSFLLYRDINHPVEILKNSLNNLSMGGEKRRINLKFQNEFGSLIEAYNRYLDNLTSTSKRLVECPNCRNPYEMGDSFCRQCGRKLRFDT